MEQAVNENISEQYETIGLQLKKKLIPIEDFAAQYKIPEKTVEKYGQLGIVHIRKYKGKTLVVDYPFDTQQVSQESMEKMAETINQLCRNAGCYDKLSNDTPDDMNLDEIMAEPLRMDSPEMLEIIKELAKEEDHAELIKTPELENTKTNNNKNFLKDKIGKISTWKTLIILSIVCFLASIFVNFWFFNQQKTQIEALNQTYLTALNAYKQYNRQMKTYQGKLQTAGLKADNIQSQLADLEAKIQSLNNEPDQTREKLE